MSSEEKSVRMRSEPRLIDIYDELALDLGALEAMASLIGEYNGDFGEGMLSGIEEILQRIHDSIREKHEAIGELYCSRVPREEGGK